MRSRFEDWGAARGEGRRLAAGFEFFSMVLFVLWLFVLTPAEWGWRFFAVDARFLGSGWDAVDFLAGVAMWGFYAAGRVNWRRFEAAPLRYGVGVCGVCVLVVAVLLWRWLAGRGEAAPVFVSWFLLWAFAVWTVWSGVCGRFVACLVGPWWAGMMRDDEIFGFLFGGGMPMGGMKGGVVDAVVRLLSLVVLGGMFWAMGGVSVMFVSTDALLTFFDFTDGVVDFFAEFFWVGGRDEG